MHAGLTRLLDQRELPDEARTDGQGTNRGYVHSLTDLRIEGSGFSGEIEMFALKVAYELMV